MNLVELAHEYQTKVDVNYCWIYQQYFEGLRDQEIKLLELGIAEGNSIQLWHEYFSKAEIYGVDIDLSSIREDFRKTWSKRVHIFLGDASNINLAEVGPFDIIIDDASHINREQQKSLQNLWPQVKMGGLYVIEDLQTSYWTAFGGGLRRRTSTIEMLKGLIDSMNYAVQDGWEIEPGFDNKIAFIHFYQCLAIISKGENENARSHVFTLSNEERSEASEQLTQAIVPRRRSEG